jgi:hypothetical protein
MAYKFTILENRDYIRVEASGKWTPGKELDDVSKVLAQVSDICQNKNKNYILAIWDVEGPLPVMIGYDIVESANKFNWGRNFKLALVFTYQEKFKDAHFVETAAVNRGYWVKMFENEHEAKLWLLGS